jgi:hypothetical protein
MATIFLFFACSLAVIYVFASLDAKERARAIARRICADARVQLLDQTVSLRQVRFVRTRTGFALRRRYGFEFSVDGTSRERGSISLVGRELESSSVPQAPV